MNNTQMESTILQVPIEDIIPNRFQPRLSFDDASLNDLATSIKQHGVIQPLVLRRKNDKYEIIAGERRYKASKLAGLASVPAIIANLDDNTSAEVAIVENIQRKDLTAIEEAKSYQALLEKGYMTQEELSRKMGLSQSAISNKLRLLSLDETVQDAILQEKISERHARTLLKISDHDLQRKLLDKTINERLTVKQLEEEIKQLKGSDSIKEQGEVPVVSSEPDINRIINESVDITPIETPKEDLIEEKTSTTTESTNNLFSSPEKAPSKFFNVLEDTAANMDVVEPVQIVELPKEEPEEIKPADLLQQTENIEMLDDFIIPTTASNDEKVMNDDYLNEVIKTIRNLNLDRDKVEIEEINLPTEYKINITIKKDKL